MAGFQLSINGRFWVSTEAFWVQKRKNDLRALRELRGDSSCDKLGAGPSFLET